MSTTVTYKGATLATAVNQTKTLKTAGKYLEDDVTIVDVTSGGTPNLQTKTATYTPSESQQTATITADVGYDGLDEVDVTVNAISPTYVGSGIDRRDSSDLTASSATVTVPSGYYSSSASKTIASGTAGIPVAEKSTVSNHTITVVPSVINTAGYIQGGSKMGTGVPVSASELVSGNKSITQNGTDIDVTNYETVSVNVSGGGSTKNVQYNMGSASVHTNGYTSTGMSITVAKTGTYKVSWAAWRSSSQGTMGTNLYKNESAGTNQQTWTNTYGQCITLNNQSYSAGDVLTLYATAGSTTRYCLVANLIIEEQ